MPALRPAGGAGGIGAVRHWRELDRPPRTSIAAIHTTDTALIEAGVELGGKERRHDELTRTNDSDNEPRDVERACPRIEQFAIRPIPGKKTDFRPRRPFTLR